MSASEQSAPRWWNLEPREAGILGGILIATAVLYLPSVRNGWVYDDPLQIVNNDLLHTWAGIGKSFIYDSWWFLYPDNLPASAYYRPLQATWFGLNYMILGNHAGRMASRKNRGRTDRGDTFLPPRAIAHPQHRHWVADGGNLRTAVRQRRGGSVGVGDRGTAVGDIRDGRAVLPHQSRAGGKNGRAGWCSRWCFTRCAAESRDGGSLLVDRRRVRFSDRSKRLGESMRLAAPFLMLAIAYLVARLNALGPIAYFALPFHQPTFVLLGWARPVPPPSLLGLILTAPVALLGYLGVLMVPGVAGPAHNLNWIDSSRRSRSSRRASWRCWPDSPGRGVAEFVSQPLPVLRGVEPDNLRAFDETRRDRRADRGPRALRAVVRIQPGACDAAVHLAASARALVRRWPARWRFCWRRMRCPRCESNITGTTT